jgi:predicted RNase H-like HicB family nuclease
MEYTAIIEKGNNGWYVAQCAEIPGAISQGKTIEEAKNNLSEAIELILLDEKQDTINIEKGE